MTNTTHSLKQLRNIGISAHVDAGKTTLTERILFYTGRIHRMGEVHDSDGKGATMDTDKAEKAHGITIKSAATQVHWDGHAITIIDTPGHADFTVEVERALRVLDGAVFVLSAVEGVQAQSITVDRQMRRHGVPRIAFINKMDRVGADALAVVRGLRDRLGLVPALVQLPVGSEGEFRGVIDLLEMRCITFAGEHGGEVVVGDIPSGLSSAAAKAREALIDTVSRADERLLEEAVEGSVVSGAALAAAIRRATLGHRLVPVLVGSAFRNVGVQPLLDAVTAYLPDPSNVTNVATSHADASAGEVELASDPQAPACGFVFKVDETRFGALAYVRLYQGTLQKGTALWSSQTGKRFRLGRLLRLHADDPTPIDSASAGEIVGLFGLAVRSGDTLCGADPETGQPLQWALSSFDVPPPVVSRTVRARDEAAMDKLSKALGRYGREDPSLRVGQDPESGLTLIAGTGILQLELYAERLEDEHGLEVVLGEPQVAYRETVTAELRFDYLHRKQSGGGAGQFAGVSAFVRPTGDTHTALRFVERIRGGSIPREYLSSCEKGFLAALEAGPVIGAPVVGVEVELVDGRTHSNDSSDLAFHLAARDGLREALAKAAPALLEPVMRVEVETPESDFGVVQASIAKRRGSVLESEVHRGQVRIAGKVPLAEMFDYATDLSGITSGRGSHAMTMLGYEPVPTSVAKAIIERTRS